MLPFSRFFPRLSPSHESRHSPCKTFCGNSLLFAALRGTRIAFEQPPRQFHRGKVIELMDLVPLQKVTLSCYSFFPFLLFGYLGTVRACFHRRLSHLGASSLLHTELEDVSSYKGASTSLLGAKKLSGIPTTSLHESAGPMVVVRPGGVKQFSPPLSPTRVASPRTPVGALVLPQTAPLHVGNQNMLRFLEVATRTLFYSLSFSLCSTVSKMCPTSYESTCSLCLSVSPSLCVR